MNRIHFLCKSTAACVLSVFLPACGSITPEWNRARTAAADPFAGQWDGKWSSAKRPGEGGQLRCVFTPVDPTHYRAAFEAHWKVFKTSYSADLETKRHGKQLAIQGTHLLPAVFGGLYRYHGVVTADRFFANYDSSYDRGTFEMTRPKP